MANPKISKEYCVTPYRDERGRFVKRPETEAKVKQTKRASAPTPPPPPPAPPRPKVFKRTTKKVVKKGVLKRGRAPGAENFADWLDKMIQSRTVKLPNGYSKFRDDVLQGHYKFLMAAPNREEEISNIYKQAILKEELMLYYEKAEKLEYDLFNGKKKWSTTARKVDAQEDLEYARKNYKRLIDQDYLKNEFGLEYPAGTNKVALKKYLENRIAIIEKLEAGTIKTKLQIPSEVLAREKRSLLAVINAANQQISPVTKRTTKKVVKKGVLKRGRKPVDYLVKPYLDQQLPVLLPNTQYDGERGYAAEDLFKIFVVEYMANPGPENEKAAFDRWLKSVSVMTQIFDARQKLHWAIDRLSRERNPTEKQKRQLRDLERDKELLREKYKYEFTSRSAISAGMRNPPLMGARQNISENELQREFYEGEIAYFSSLLDKFSRQLNGLIPRPANWDSQFEQLLKQFVVQIESELRYAKEEYAKLKPDRVPVQRRKFAGKKIIKLKRKVLAQPFPPDGLKLDPDRKTYNYGIAEPWQHPCLVFSGVRDWKKINPNMDTGQTRPTLNDYVNGTMAFPGNESAKLVAIATRFGVLMVNDKVTPKMRKVFGKASRFWEYREDSEIKPLIRPEKTEAAYFLGLEKSQRTDIEMLRKWADENIRDPRTRAKVELAYPNGVLIFGTERNVEFRVAVDTFRQVAWSDAATGEWSFRAAKVAEPNGPILYAYRGKTLIGVVAGLKQ